MNERPEPSASGEGSAPETRVEAAPRPPGRWLARLGVVLTASALAAGLMPAVAVFPYVRDDYRLDGIVRAAALDWRDFGEAKGRERLAFEIDRSGVGPWVSDAACGFEGTAEARRVACRWHVVVPLPVVGRPLPLDFVSEATIGAAGEVR